jgi:hypothetical protein
MYSQFQVIAFTHSNLDVSEIGLLQIEEGERKVRLAAVKAEMVGTPFSLYLQPS